MNTNSSTAPGLGASFAYPPQTTIIVCTQFFAGCLHSSDEFLAMAVRS
jgi:hypothetical protein